MKMTQNGLLEMAGIKIIGQQKNGQLMNNKTTLSQIIM